MNKHRPPQEPAWPGRPALGPLETRVLDVLWSAAQPMTVREAHRSFPELAYTTLMTTLDRLYRKGLTVRRRRGRAFAYEPDCTRDELVGRMVSNQVADLLGSSGAGTALLSTLVHAVGRTDAALLDELEMLVREARRRLDREEP